MTLLTLKEIEKSFEDQPVLRGITLEVLQGEILVLLGPSGCGKTTLLRIIAGLESSDGGQVLLSGKDLARVDVHERGFGMVFQDYALFPHKNVFENVGFGLRMHGWPKARLRARVEQVLELVGLSGFAERAVYDLSGGEQQRVALARSLAPAPRLLLLDEPLGSLDRALRERLMSELRAILKEAGGVIDRPEGITTIYVTHDQEEAFALADRIAVMNQGLVEQLGRPMILYTRPRNAFVARFLGMENLLPAQVASTSPPEVDCSLGSLRVADAAHRGVGEQVTLLIRPGAGRLLADGEETANAVSGTLRHTSFRGRHQVAQIAAQSGESELILKLEFDSTTILPDPGQPLAIGLDPRRLIVLE
jgi:ABC-type Fe3+/spermidine/putrescine transport system ATPase subunit